MRTFEEIKEIVKNFISSLNIKELNSELWELQRTSLDDNGEIIQFYMNMLNLESAIYTFVKKVGG